MKRILAAVLAAITVFTITGCRGREEPADHVPPGPETAEHSGGDSPGGVLRELTCVRGAGYPVALEYAGEGAVALVCTQDPMGGESREPDMLYMIDAESDELLFRRELPPEEALLAAVSPEKYITSAPDSDELKIYSAEGEPEILLCYGTPGGFDRERGCLAVMDDRTYYELYLDGSRGRETVFPAELRPDVRTGLALGFLPGESDVTGSEYAVFSLESGELLFWGDTEFSAEYGFSGGRLISVKNEFDVNGSEAVAVTHAESGEAVSAWHVPPFLSMRWGGRGPTLGYELSYGPDGAARGLASAVMFDFVKGRFADITELLPPTDIFGCVAMDDREAVVMALSGDGRETETRLFTLSESVLDLGADLTPAPMPEPPGLYSAADTMPEARAIADGLEGDFSVRVCIGDECLTARPGDYRIISTEDEAHRPEGENTEERVIRVLSELRQGLERYPEGFFERFLSYRGGGGLRLLLVRDLENPLGDFSAGGVTFSDGSFYTIALDIDQFPGLQSLHHEMWHAVELRVCDLDPYAFDAEEWRGLNPPGFKYGNDLEDYHHEQLLPYMLWGERPYFIQMYSTVTDHEDRATIIEEIYSDTYDPASHGGMSSYERLCTLPHIKAKLDYMAAAIRRTFGGAYWK